MAVMYDGHKGNPKENLMNMRAYIHYKTLYLLSQNRLIAGAYANYVLEDLKDYIHSKRMKQNRNYQSIVSSLTNTTRYMDSKQTH